MTKFKSRFREILRTIGVYPKWVWIFATLCALMPVVLGVTPFSLFLAFLGVLGCLGAGINQMLSQPRRIVLCAFMTGAVWLIFFLLGAIIFAML